MTGIGLTSSNKILLTVKNYSSNSTAISSFSSISLTVIKAYRSFIEIFSSSLIYYTVTWFYQSVLKIRHPFEISTKNCFLAKITDYNRINKSIPKSAYTSSLSIHKVTRKIKKTEKKLACALMSSKAVMIKDAVEKKIKINAGKSLGFSLLFFITYRFIIHYFSGNNVSWHNILFYGTLAILSISLTKVKLSGKTHFESSLFIAWLTNKQYPCTNDKT